MPQMDNEGPERHCPNDAMCQHLVCGHMFHNDKVQWKYAPHEERDERGDNAVARLFFGRLYFII